MHRQPSDMDLSDDRLSSLNPLSAAKEEQKIPAFTRDQWKGTAVREGSRFSLRSIPSFLLLFSWQLADASAADSDTV